MSRPNMAETLEQADRVAHIRTVLIDALEQAVADDEDPRVVISGIAEVLLSFGASTLGAEQMKAVCTQLAEEAARAGDTGD